jgi:hypothetical protein
MLEVRCLDLNLNLSLSLVAPTLTAHSYCLPLTAD